MKRGTASILFGVHQFLWHPFTVFIAWMRLYRKFPTWREAVCIVVHDWGYWGKEKMDDEEGEKHPELGAKIAGWLFDYPLAAAPWIKTTDYYDLCLLHSRHYARNAGKEPSRLCWADKMSILCDPWWLYLPRAWASGELQEYRIIAAETGFCPLSASNREWFRWLQGRLEKLGREKRGDVVTYANPLRSDNGEEKPEETNYEHARNNS